MILDEIAEYTKERVRALKAHKSLYAVRDEAEGRPQGKDFRAALAAPGLSVIAELKKASPSKGIIAPGFTDIYLRKAAEYEAGGAAAISCLTEPKFFQGSDAYLQAVRQRVELPLLRKDFTLDEYQIYEAKCIGADAVLLICSLLSAAQLGEYLAQAQELRERIADLDAREPADMMSAQYERWSARHEALEDALDDILDLLDE